MTTKISSPTIDADICFLLIYPYQAKEGETAVATGHSLKRAPYFQPVDVDVRVMNAGAVQIEGTHVSLQPQVYDELVSAVECRFSLPDALSVEGHARVQRAKEALVELLVPQSYRQTEMWEEYLLLLLPGVAGTPEGFVTMHDQALARFLRSERGLFSRDDVESILGSRMHYTAHDLTIVDWEGGIVIAADGDYQSDIEVIKIANYQLLRYRMLDKRIEERLRTIRKLFDGRRRKTLLPAQPRRTVQQIIQEKLTLLLDFERIDQDLLMIGDWYTAELYRMVIDEFYLDEWKDNVKAKLGNLESIVQTVQDNFTVSWSYFLDMVQLVGWLLLLLGYIYLFYLDSISYGLLPSAP